MNLKNGKVFTNKYVGTGPFSYEKKNLPGHGLTMVEKHCCRQCDMTFTEIKNKSPAVLRQEFSYLA